MNCDNLTVPDVLPEYARCTFENGICGWRTMERVKGFSWKRHYGPSPTVGTGPDIDHTTGTMSGVCCVFLFVFCVLLFCPFRDQKTIRSNPIY